MEDRHDPVVQRWTIPVAVELVLALIAILYATAIGFGVHAIVRRRHKLGRRMWWTRTSISAFAALGIGCFLYARLIEPTWLAVTHIAVPTAKLAKPIRIVHISDVHSDPEARLEDRLPDVIAAEHPDLIVFTGDSINSPESLPNFRGLMTHLAEIAPTYAVRGNWDVWYWNRIDLFGGTGVVELSGAQRVALDGRELWIAGLPVGDEGRLPAVMATVPPGALTLLLFHYPDEIEHAAALGVDLYCAGHTHGGQVALPFYGALVTFSKFGKRFEAGEYHVGPTTLYVNRGIGMEGGSAPRIRFFARPEVTVIDLQPAR